MITPISDDEKAAEFYIREFGPKGYSWITRDSDLRTHMSIFLAGCSHKESQLSARIQELEEEHRIWEKHSLCQIVKERDKLFLELGKYADIPRFEFWKDKAEELERKLSLAGNACGIAATFLEFHGRPSKQLDECIKMMKYHEESALKQLDESNEIESANKEKA